MPDFSALEVRVTGIAPGTSVRATLPHGQLLPGADLADRGIDHRLWFFARPAPGCRPVAQHPVRGRGRGRVEPGDDLHRRFGPSRNLDRAASA